VLVDTTGLGLVVAVHEANIQDRQGVPLLARIGFFVCFSELWKCPEARKRPGRSS